MRIAFLTDSYKPDLSGLVVSVETFARELENLGHAVTIIAPQMGDGAQSEPGLIRIPSLRAPFESIRNYYLMRPLVHENRLIRSIRPDVIHTHTPFTAGLWGLRLARRYAIPSVTTYHTLLTEYCHYIPLPQNPLKHAAIRTSRWYCNQCDGVVAPSERVRELLKSIGVFKPIRVIPTGVAIERFGTADGRIMRDKLGIPADATVLLYVGRVAREKNIPFLFQVYQQVFRSNPKTWGVVVGGGPELDHLRALAHEMGLSSRLVFTGMVPFDKIPEYYACGDVFTFASVTETQGLVIAEALAAGLPVVAVDEMGVKGMVRDGVDGWQAQNDLDSFESRVRRLVDNPSVRAEMAHNALERAQSLSSREMSRQLASFYEETILKYDRQRRMRRRA